MLVKLADDEDDVLLAERARDAGLALHALSRWYIKAPPQRGLLFGFANVADEAEARRLARALKRAMG